MLQNLFLSFTFSLPILLGFIISEFIKLHISKKYYEYLYDIFWTLGFLAITFGLLDSITFIGPKISLILSSVVVIYLFSFILSNFLNQKIDNNNISALFIKNNFKQLFLLFVYLSWVSFLIGGNISFFSNITIGMIIIEILKFIPIFILLFMTFSFFGINNKNKIYYFFTIYFILLLILIFSIFLTEKLFKFYVPNISITLQILLGFFLLIFFTDYRIQNKEKGFMSKGYKYQFIYIIILIIIILIIKKFF